jgi:glycerophosphoryl diester phosphodiesterase
MRSSRSAADPLGPGPNGFTHRGLHAGGEFPENSYRAFAAALEGGCGIECDLRLTADNQILIFHDEDAWRMCGSPLRIGQSSMADLAAFRVGGQPIPTLAGLLRLVSGRVPLLLEVKVDRDLWRWIPVLRPLLTGYTGRFGVMSFDPRLPRLLRTHMPNVRRGLVVEAGLSRPLRWLYLWLADPNFVAVETGEFWQPWIQRIRRYLPVYGWTVCSREQRTHLAVQADALIWEGDGRP